MLTVGDRIKQIIKVYRFYKQEGVIIEVMPPQQNYNIHRYRAIFNPDIAGDGSDCWWEEEHLKKVKDPVFKVGERAIQINNVFLDEKRAVIITKINGNAIWHKHIGTSYSDGDEQYQKYGTASVSADFIKVGSKKNV